MKLLSFTADGKDYFGAVSGDGVVTLNDKIGQPSLRAALAAGAMDAMRKAARRRKPDRKLADIEFLPVIPHPEKILCAGVNYRAHAAEVGRELPKQPSMFIRFADTLVGHGGEMIRPNVSDNFDYEGELTARHRQRRAVTSRPSTRSTMSPATPVSSTAACATSRNSR